MSDKQNSDITHIYITSEIGHIFIPGANGDVEAIKVLFQRQELKDKISLEPEKGKQFSPDGLRHELLLELKRVLPAGMQIELHVY
ncbi:MAG: hypothetical protein WAV73_05405 [Candidatus Moraniibacteriota bacterium]